MIQQHCRAMLGHFDLLIRNAFWQETSMCWHTFSFFSFLKPHPIFKWNLFASSPLLSLLSHTVTRACVYLFILNSYGCFRQTTEARALIYSEHSLLLRDVVFISAPHYIAEHDKKKSVNSLLGHFVAFYDYREEEDLQLFCILLNVNCTFGSSDARQIKWLCCHFESQYICEPPNQLQWGC